MSEELSPAERFARAKQNRVNPALESFLNLLSFPLDDFQEKACRALMAGHGVLVAASQILSSLRHFLLGIQRMPLAAALSL